MNIERQTPEAALNELQSEVGPDLLLGYQKRLIETTAVSRVTVCEKSRRIGFTWGIAADAVLTAASARKAGGMDVFYIGYNLDMAREFIDTSGGWAKLFNHGAGAVNEFMFDDSDDSGERHIKAFRITFASGFEICALSSRPRSLRGRQGYVIIDEAAFHDDLKALMQAALALLIWGGKVLVISTHLGVANYFNQLVTDIDSGASKYTKVRVTFDDAIADGLYRRICLVLGEEWTAEKEMAWRQDIIDFYGDGADEELFCVPRNSDGQYLSRSLIEARMTGDIPVLRWTAPDGFVDRPEHERIEATRALIGEIEETLSGIPRDARSYCGGDFGRNADLSVIWPIVMMPDLVRRPPLILELRRVPFADQRRILFALLHALPGFERGGFDATGIGAQISEECRQEFGVERIEEVKLSTEWYRVNMPLFKSGFEGGDMVMPRDRDILTDHEQLYQKNGIAQLRPTRTKGETGKRHGDSAIAHVLGYIASKGEVMLFGYTPARGAPSSGPAGMQEDGMSDLDRMFGRARFGRGGW